MKNIHATCIKLNDSGVLLLGRSGAKKSLIALHMIRCCGAALVADDRINLSLDDDGELTAFSPENIAGKIELHHVGIFEMQYCASAKIALAVQLVNADDDRLERLPQQQYLTADDIGGELPAVASLKIPKIIIPNGDVAAVATAISTILSAQKGEIIQISS